MSRITLAPNASGTGTLTVAAPNTNTDRTITLPDATGTAVVNKGSEIFNIDSGGNLGMGTTSPVGAGLTLNLQGSSSSSYSSIVAGSPSNANFVSFYSGQTSDPNPSIVYNNSLRIGSATSPNTSGYAERFRFGSSGQFGVAGANYGTSGQVLTSGGSGAAPSWSAAPAPTTAQVGAATAALAVGDVGSYAWLTYQTASGAVAVGTTFAGANLRYHGVVVVNADAAGACGVWGGAPSGTWRCMGSNGANGGRFPTNIYLRIS